MSNTGVAPKTTNNRSNNRWWNKLNKNAAKTQKSDEDVSFFEALERQVREKKNTNPKYYVVLATWDRKTQYAFGVGIEFITRQVIDDVEFESDYEKLYERVYESGNDCFLLFNSNHHKKSIIWNESVAETD